jgi:hypothetical protein
MSNVTQKRHNKQSKLEAFSLDFEYNRTLKEERQALRERTVKHQ